MKNSKIFFILIFLLSIGAQAQEEHIARQYETEKTKLLEKEIKKRNILSDLYKIKTEMKRLDKEKTNLVSNYNKVKNKYEILNQQVEELEIKVKNQKEEIRKRLIFMVKFQDLGVLKLIFSSQTPSELDRNLKILKILTERDYILLKSYFKNIKMRVVKRDQLRAQKERLSKLSESVQKKEQQLLESNTKKTALLGEIQTQKALSMIKLKKIRLKRMPDSDEKSKAEAFYDTLLRPMMFEAKGQLELPVAGKIIQKYGFFKDPVYKTKLRHKGIFIAAKEDSAVASIYEGSVSFSGRIPGFGKTLIVSHGDHYYSVYGHLEKISVSTGDQVEQNQVIAVSGSSNPMFGSGVYFEIRHFSEPLDPLEWVVLPKEQGELNASIQ